MNTGIIGVRGQAARWAEAASAGRDWNVRYCYHPDPDRHLPGSPFEQTHNLDDLITGCDIIVIASPTHTHLHYLQKLAPCFSGLVIIEKPIAASLEECQALLETVPQSFLDRVFVNHSFRVYPWARRAHEILRSGAERRPFAADFQLTHDLAYKPQYRESWRSQLATHPIGPAETLGIHVIDLIHYLFGAIASVSGRLLNLALAGSAPDTASMYVTTQSQVCCTVHTSYAAPTAHYMRLVAPELVLTYRDGIMNLQERPPSKSDLRSRPPLDQTILNTNPDELSAQALCHQLRCLQGVLRNMPDEEIATAYQGIANVAVLGGFLKSVQQGAPCSLKEIPIYRATVGSFG